MASFLAGGRLKEVLSKYGKVALGVHFSVSAASITGLYIAINNNVDVDSILRKVGISAPAPAPSSNPNSPDGDLWDGFVTETQKVPEEKRNWASEMMATGGGAFALAVICNKALYPIRVPITIALTPPVARFLAKRNIV